MRRLLSVLLVVAAVLLPCALALATDPPSGDTPGNDNDPIKLLYATWHCCENTLSQRLGRCGNQAVPKGGPKEQ